MMRLFYTTFLLFFLTFSFNKLSAQNHTPKTGYSQASIEGSSELVPGTGQMNYSIPLLNIQSKGIDLPITLIYNGGGVKVNDKASWIGYGWRLDVGGAVNREMNGYPDDINSFEVEDQTVKGSEGYLFREFDYTTEPEVLSDVPTSPWIWSQINLYDFQPDVFHYKGLSGLSGSFGIRSNGDLEANKSNIPNEIINLTLNGDDIQGSTNSNRQLQSFKIKAINGVIYKFDKAEKTVLHDYKSIPEYSYNSDWLLTEVADELEQQIYNFTYSNNSVINYDSYSAQSNVSEDISTNNGASSNYQEVSFHKKYINSVHFDEGRVEFILGVNQRDDLTGHYPLKFIRVFDSSDNLLHEIEFFQSYSVNWLNTNSRLRLDSIKVKEYPTNEATQTINFSYNDIQLPEDNSSDFDFWGYYNHANNDNLLLFRRYLTRPEPRIGNTSYLNDLKLIRQFTFSSDHKPNLMYTEAASLERIDYSSGKSIRFNYELNDYSFIEDTLNAVGGQVEDVKQYNAGITYENGQPYWSYSIYIPETLIEYPQWVKIKYIQNGCNISEGRFKPYINANSDHITVQSGEEEWVFLEPGVSYYFNSDNLPGTPPPPCPASGVAPALQIVYKKQVEGNPASYRKTAGGLRLKSVITSDNNGENSTRFFNYDLEGSNGLKSSGVIITEPNTFFMSGQIYDDGVLPIYSIKSSFNQASYLSANSVYYTNVEEFSCPSDFSGNCIGNSSQSEIGRILKKYSFTKPPEEAFTFPFLPVTENNSKRLLLKKEIFKTADNVKVKEITYEYESINNQEDRLVGNLATPIQYNTNYALEYYRQFGYQIFPETTRLFKTDVKDFNSESNSSSSTQEIDYVNDYNLCKLPKEEVKVGIDGTMSKVESSYSGSFNFDGINPNDAVTTSMKMLVDQGRITEPIEEIHFIKKSNDFGIPFLPVSRVRYFYKIGSTGKILLDKKVVSRIDNPESAIISLTQLNGNTFPHEITNDESVTTYSDYDLDNIPHTLSNENDEKTSLLVNSKNQVIANIAGAAFDMARYTSFEDPEFNGGWYYSPDHVIPATESETALTGDAYYYLGTVDGIDGDFNSGGGVTNPALPAGKYLISYWAKGNVATSYNNSGAELNQSSFTENGWTYIEKIIQWENTEDNYVTFGGDGYIDELRLHEIDAAMETKGYYPDGKVMYEASASGDVVTYEYDSKNRLEWVLDRKRNVIEHREYEEKDIADEDSYNKVIVSSTRVDDITKQEVLTAGLDDYDVKKSMTFSDGLGRFRQSIQFRADNTGASDLVQFAEYDPFGRELKKYQPYWATYLDTESDYIQTAKTDQATFYSSSSSLDPLEQTDSPFTETELEASPLQRPIQQGGIGDELQLDGVHTTTMEYSWNDANDAILKWEYDAANHTASSSGNFPINALKKNTRTSPDGKTVHSYTDARGQNVAIAAEARVATGADGKFYTHKPTQYGPGGTLRTFVSYTVYDDFGRVVYEIPAKAIEEMGSTFQLNPDNPTNTFKELINWYKYDAHGRVIEKQTPGQGRTYFVYDRKDRLVMSQDAQQEADNKWSFIKRDTRGRVVLKGEIASSQNRQDHQDYFDNDPIYEESFDPTLSGNVLGYSNDAHPSISEAVVLNVYYFDTYDFSYSSDFNYLVFNAILEPMEVTRGLATGSKTRILKSDGTLGDWLTTISYYDTKKRPIQAFTENHKGGWDRIDTYYNLSNQIEKTIQYHRLTSAGEIHTFRTRYSYFEASGMLQNTWCRIDMDPEVLVSNRNYDIQGRLKELKLHRREDASNFLQRINYRYNAQGNLVFINDPALTATSIGSSDFDDVFGQQLVYFDTGQELEYDPNNSTYDITPRYDGNISAMLWNAKTPEEDGTTLKQNAYIYHYDDFGQMTAANYAADDPAFPGEYNTDVGHFNESVEYGLGGTMRSLSRNGIYMQEENILAMDSLKYEYLNAGYKPMNIDDWTHQVYDPNLKHFVDGADAHHEYTYDAVGRTLTDQNRGVTFYYNRLGLPRKIVHNATGYYIEYTYDAAGNKLQKKFKRELPETQQMEVVSKDYIGNFLYEQDNLELIYHPEGVIRPTPPEAENTTDYVYDYFIKDYLGNVRVVLTEENATYTNKFLATMEEVYRQIEEDNFDNINETAEPLPSGYPIDGSVEFNERIAELSEATGTQIGPSIVLPVRRGDKVSLSTRYFYDEPGEGTTYDNVNLIVNEILMSLATSGSGVLQLNETQLIDIASGSGDYGSAIMNLLSSNFDTSDVSRPNSYLIWMLYDNEMKLIPEGSGAKRVSNPNELGTLIEQDIPALTDGYLHCFVSNSAVQPVSYDNFLASYLRGQTRQINHYYPYGLSISGLGGNYDEYLNKYTSKELQTGEFDPLLSSGLEMFDFHARYYDPALGRWFTPDPAEQFANPYLAMGNNPVMYVDPDGEFIFAAVLIGAAISGTIGYIGGKKAGLTGGDLFAYTLGSAVIGGVSGGVGASVGAGVSASLSFGGFAGGFVAGAAGGAAGGFVGGFYSTALNNSTFGTNNNVFLGGLKGAAIGGIAGGLGGGIARGISDFRNGYSFWDGSTVDEVLIQGGNPEAIAAKYNSSSQADVNDEFLKVRIQDEFRVTEGDFGIEKITTRTSRGYGMDVSGDYVNLKNGSTVGGYVKRFSTGSSNLHVSPNSTFSGDVTFRAIAGHELIHSYHHFTIPSFNRIFSERVAYRYTYNTFMGAGNITTAFDYYNIAVSHGFWGSYPGQYQIPTPLGW